MVREVKLKHPLNALFPMTVAFSVSLIATDFKLVHLENAMYPMLFTLAGMRTDVKSVQL